MTEPLSLYWRQRIGCLSQEGLKISQIVSTMESEGRRTSRATVSKWISRLKSNQGLTDKHRSGRPTKVTGVISAFIESKLDEDDEISSAELERLVARMFSTQISAPTIRRHIRMTLEWTVVRTRLGPMISEQNKIKRYHFAKTCIETGDMFNNVIWTDESSVQLTRHCRTMRVKVGKERIFKPAPKHALKVHVWAGISKRGATHICVFDQIMDGPLYVKILEDHLLPFLSEAFPGGDYRFMQDNDPKHTSRVAKDFFEEKDIKWWPTPASSADFNPIERIWAELKHYIARTVKPISKKELVAGITSFWKERMTAEKCCAYIGHTFSVLPKIVAKHGGITGE